MSNKSYFEEINEICDKEEHTMEDVYNACSSLLTFIQSSSLKLYSFKNKLLTNINHIEELLYKITILIENRTKWCVYSDQKYNKEDYNNITEMFNFKKKVYKFLKESLNKYGYYNSKYIQYSEIMDEIKNIELISKLNEKIEEAKDYKILNNTVKCLFQQIMTIYKNYNKTINDMIIKDEEFNSFNLEVETNLNDFIKKYDEYLERSIHKQKILYQYKVIKEKGFTELDLLLSFKQYDLFKVYTSY